MTQPAPDGPRRLGDVPPAGGPPSDAGRRGAPQAAEPANGRPRGDPPAPALDPAAQLEAARAALAVGDPQAAVRHLRALFAGSPHLEALFYCGAVMEQLRNVDGARRWYEHVLMLDETHAGARARLAAIRRTPAGPSASPPSAAPPERASAQAGTQPGQPKSSQPWISTTGSPRSSAPSAVPDNAAAAASDGTGFYAALKADANPLSRNAVALIDRLRLTSRPRVADYPIALMGLVLSAFVSLVLSFLMLWDALRGANVAPEAVALFTGAPLVVTCLSGFWILQRRATRYELGDGLLKATRGLVAKETVTYELFRVTRVGVYRGPVQRLFGSGTLTLVVEGRGGAAEEVKLVGLVPGRDLLRMQDDLRNLAQLLRQNALIKGIIT